ncbi:hypothetical protein [Paenibacillus segetis]|uniref:Import inner membrane translocase subunit Tim44 n=1 Tax=Paenibacillus segetis TaxID=1325360 RepID=A0ABQ1YK56_9BACL|nr:hypothetical protein [Paenibacillus segetis]GGH27895.1 hypothetical protein GCM10008013_29580 [Paenibacillus segetis]
MIKKIMMFMMAFTLILAFVSPDVTDAKRRGGGFSRPGTSLTTPNKSTTSDFKKTDTTSNNKSTSGTSQGANAGRGFFSGGSLMKGLMIGGLAGMLFGGMFSGMGFFGNLLGMAVNLFAIFLIVMVIAALYRRFKNQPRRPKRIN